MGSPENAAPLIAVTGVPLAAGGVSGWRFASVGVLSTYLEALARAGAQPVIVPPVDLDDETAAVLLSRFDGLCAVGGGDLDPATYGQAKHPAVSDTSPVRDGFEIPLLRGAVAGQVPTLAICRGLQVLNVALGGTLHQHISEQDGLVEHRQGSVGIDHGVKAAAGSRLAQAMGTERAPIHSQHHQALDRLGAGLVPVAWADDGLLEGVEHIDGWIVGIQWHAEVTAGADPRQQAIFDAFAQVAAAVRL